jgi:lipopolysaccharide biosynthesis regulator YciM
MDPSHVLYLHMFSGDQLLAEAEAALGSKDWNGAEVFLSRALAAGAETLPAEYLRAILARGREQYGEAHIILKTLTETEKKTPYLWLFLADLCQYHLNRPGEAGEYLAKFLTLRHDVDVEQRLKKLREKAPADEHGTGAGVPEHESAGESPDGNADGDVNGTNNGNAG